MKLEEKRLFWQKHIEGWRESGLSQKAYCEQHSLKQSTFAYWRARTSRAKAGSKLIPVTVTSSQTVTITLAAGLQLDVPVVLLDQVLPVILQSLRETS